MTSIHINNTLRHVAGNAHKITVFDWNTKNMPKQHDALEKALIDMKEDYTKFLNKHFIENIFRIAHEQLPPLKKY